MIKFFRFLDIIFSLTIILLLSPVYISIFFICAVDTGKPIFSQTRLGRYEKEFTIYKFRTMGIATESLPTHKVDKNNVTKIGQFLRRLKLDEIPQIYNILLGDMSFVGPRPNLPQQFELIRERRLLNVYRVRPGLTGLAQIEGIDMSNPKLLAIKDNEMLAQFTITTYIKYIFQTALMMGSRDSISYK